MSNHTDTPLDISDGDLIKQFVEHGATAAFETLVRRHYSRVHGRLLSITHNSADADDLAQKLWLKVLEYLPKYKDKQKFAHFVNTIATNLVKDEWRKKSNIVNTSLDEILDAGNNSSELVALDEEELADQLHTRAEIDYLVKSLIPSLKISLRAVFLLRHESEFWDGQQPFQWQHLADLNNISVEEAYGKFIGARDSMLSDGEQDNPLQDEERLIFLTWTQAQRFEKSSKQTEAYLAKLLNIPLNTFKTRYRKAQSVLQEGLEQWREAKAV